MTGLFFASFGMSLNFASIENILPKTDLVENQQSANVIASDEDAERFAERYENQAKVDKNFYVKYGEAFFKSYCVVGLSLLLLFFYNHKKADKKFIFLMASGLGLMSFSNMVTFSPSLSGRMSTIATVFILAAAIQFLLTIKNYGLNVKKMNLVHRLLVIFLISSIPMVLFQMSYLIQMLSFFTLVLPPVSWFLGNADFSIREGISQLF